MATCRNRTCSPTSRSRPSARTRAHRPAGHARAGTDGPAGATPGAGRCGRGAEASWAGSGRAPGGARGLDRSLAAHGGELRCAGAHDDGGRRAAASAGVPGHDDGAERGAAEQHAAGLPPRPRRLPAISGSAGRTPATAEAGRDRCAYLRALSQVGVGARLAAPAVCPRSASCSSFWSAEGAIADDPARGFAGPKKGRPLPKIAVGGRGRPLIEAARRRTGRQGTRARARAASAMR